MTVESVPAALAFGSSDGKAPQPSNEDTPPAAVLDAMVGVADRRLAELVTVALSRVIGETSPKGQYVRRLSEGLQHYAVTEVRRHGQVFAAPYPAMTGKPCSCGTTVLRRLGITVTDHKRIWAEKRDHQGFAASFDLAYLGEFIRPELWKVVAALISDGPGLATERIERILHQEATRTVPADRSREAGAISDSFLDSLATAFKRLMRELKELAHRTTVFGEWLTPWKALPKLHVPKGQPAPRDTSVPSRQILRLVWKQLNEECERRLGVPLEEQAERIRGMSKNRFNVAGAWRCVRDRAAVGLLVVLGSRAEATIAIRGCDYDKLHRTPDGDVGPAIRLFPGKNRDEREEAWKPIPEGLALVLDAHIAYAETWGLGRKRKDPEWGLLSAKSTAPKEGMTYAGLRQRLAGQHGKGALLPKVWGDDSIGFPPHKVRAAATQMIRSRDGLRFCQDNEIDAHPFLIAEALTDHKKMDLDAYGYGGANTRIGRERLSGYGTAITWALLTTDRGARKASDAEAFRGALRKRRALEVEQTRLRREIDEAFSAQPQGATSEERLMDRVEALLMVQRLSQRDRELGEELRQLEREIERLKLDPGRLIAIPDDITFEAPDLAQIEAEETSGVPPKVRRRPAVRDWITVKELQEIAGVKSDATPRNWVQGKGIKIGDPLAPWEPHKVPVDQTLAKRKKILIAGIKPGFLDQGERRAKLLELLTDWPAGWSDELCIAHATPPDWLAKPEVDSHAA